LANVQFPISWHLHELANLHRTHLDKKALEKNRPQKNLCQVMNFDWN